MEVCRNRFLEQLHVKVKALSEFVDVKSVFLINGKLDEFLMELVCEFFKGCGGNLCMVFEVENAHHALIVGAADLVDRLTKGADSEAREDIAVSFRNFIRA